MLFPCTRLPVRVLTCLGRSRASHYTSCLGAHAASCCGACPRPPQCLCSKLLSARARSARSRGNRFLKYLMKPGSYAGGVVYLRAGSRTLAGASAYERAPVCSQGLARTGSPRTHRGSCADGLVPSTGLCCSRVCLYNWGSFAYAGRSYPRAVVCVRAGSRTLAGASAYELAPVCSQGLAPTGYSRTHTGWCAYVLCGRPCVGVRAALVRTRPRLRTGSSRTHMAAVAYEIWTNGGQPIRLLVFCT
jgi:hypothetical protein